VDETVNVGGTSDPGKAAKTGETSKPQLVEKTPQTGESSKAADAWTPRVAPEIPQIIVNEETADSGESSNTKESSETAEYELGPTKPEQRWWPSIGGMLSGSGVPILFPSAATTVAGPSGTTSEFPSVPTTDVAEGSSAAQTRSPTVESVTDSEGEGKSKMAELA
jgi:hypothetical protein